MVNAVVGQSGGPTAAINATLAGVIRGCAEAHAEGKINTLFGMRNGIEGFLAENLVDLGERFFDEEWIEDLALTPAAALGSCRKKLKSPAEDRETYEKMLGIFQKYDIHLFFYIGGNDSMDTVLKLSEYAASHDYELRVVGVPKTIDNDLAATDHTPGFGSAAKHVATTVKEIKRDISVYTVKAVTIVEIMGRDAGWLTAASALPGITGDGPDLVYLPERTFDTEEFIASVRAAMEKSPAVLVCASEGIRFADGEYVGSGSQSGATDVFGHKYLSGTGKVLEGIVKARLGCKVRSVELSLPQRCAAHIASLTDITESQGVGKHAVELALSGKTGVMATIEREEECGKYSATFGSADISGIANAIKTVPSSYINAEGNGITEEGIRYLLPLIEGETAPKYEYGLPKHVKI
ncbi:MAG: 6-phosphofructokinase [Clostridia bacterium]|nr:6-phosphofructokinase [Clostridia bacterium]